MEKQRNIRFCGFCFILLGFFSFSGEARCQSDGAIRSAIEAVLQARHPSDTAEWWRSLGPTAPKVIMSLYQSSSEIYEKIRLIDALAWFDDPDATLFLKKESEGSSNQVIKNAAIRSIGISQGEKEKDYLVKSLNHPDPLVRLETARTLKLVNRSQSKQLSEDSNNGLVRKKLFSHHPH